MGWNRPMCIADCGTEHAPESEHERVANARLIAASPALLAACRGISQQLRDLHAAIADQGLEGRFVDDSINMISEGRTAIESADAAIAAATGGK